MTIQSLPLVSSGDAKTDYRRIAETINQILAQAQFLIDDTPAVVLSGTNGVLFKAAPLYKAGNYMFGLQGVWLAAASTYWLKIATLPISSGVTGDSINVIATLNVGWSAATSWKVDIILGNRNGFAYVWRKTGTVSVCAIQCYAETDGSVSVYAVSSAGNFAYAYISIQNAGDLGSTPVILYPQPPFTTAPTGTLVFNSADTTTYPPTAP